MVGGEDFLAPRRPFSRKMFAPRRHIYGKCSPPGDFLEGRILHSTPVTNLPIMTIGGQDINWSSQIKYLGVYINSDKGFTVDLTECRRKFFITLNCILSKLNFACDLVKLKLIENYCLSSLMHCIDSGILDAKQLQLMNSWWNSVYRKIFGYFKWESVRIIICCLQKLNLTYIENLQRIKFIKNVVTREKVINNSTLCGIVNAYLHNGEFQSIVTMNNVQLHWSLPRITSAVHQAFNETCSEYML